MINYYQNRFLRFYFFIFLLFIFIGTKPYWNELHFNSDGDIDPLRQFIIIFSLLICLLSLNSIELRNKVRFFLIKKIFFSLVLFFIGLSFFWSENPSYTLRRVFVLYVVVLFFLVSINEIGTEKTYEIFKASLVFVFVINLISYFLLGFISHDHEGLFKGIHVHKNTAGAIFSVILITFFFDKLTSVKFKAVIIPFSIFFLVISGSKTSLGLVFVVVLLTSFIKLCSKLTRNVTLIVISYLIFVSLLVLIYFGFETVFYFIGDLYGDRTFTGRLFIWDFSFYFISQEPFLGWGYGGFWGVGPSSTNLLYADGFIENFGQSHNGFIDTTIQLGYLGIFFVLIFFFKMLIENLLGLVKNPQNEIKVVSFALSTFVFLHNLLESSLISSLSVLWNILIIFFILNTGDKNEKQIF